MIDEKDTIELFEELGLSTEYERQKYLVFEEFDKQNPEAHFILLDNVSHTD